MIDRLILEAMEKAKLRGHDLQEFKPYVLVCGGRDYGDKKLLWGVLDALKPEFIVTGGQGEDKENRGADLLAEQYAIEKGIPHQVVHARWTEYGKSAGPIRNSLMLKLHPDINLLIAFPGGSGTEDMVTKAAKAMIPTLRFGCETK